MATCFCVLFRVYFSRVLWTQAPHQLDRKILRYVDDIVSIEADATSQRLKTLFGASHFPAVEAWLSQVPSIEVDGYMQTLLSLYAYVRRRKHHRSLSRTENSMTPTTYVPLGLTVKE